MTFYNKKFFHINKCYAIHAMKPQNVHIFIGISVRKKVNTKIREIKRTLRTS